MLRRPLLACCLTLLLTSLAHAGPADKRLDVYWVDTEGGAATLIVSPTGESLLVDCGNPGRRDAGRVFETAVKTAGLKQIDHLVVTHYHGDHFGGVPNLVELMPVKRLYDNGDFGQREKPSKAYLDAKVGERVVINPGEKLPLKSADGGAKLTVTCLAARQKFIDAPEGAGEGTGCSAAITRTKDESDNANSVVLLVQFGDFKFYDAGDLTWNMEAKLVCPKNLIGTVDVYQATHHGLDQSNNPLVIKTVRPTVAVFNNGTTKGCEPESFATLKSTDSVKAIYQAHKNLRKDTQNNAPDEFIANTEKECKGNIIKLSVAPDGKSYTMSVPATGHEKTYETRGK